MKAVWKFTLEAVDEQMVEMPSNAHILCVQMQHGEPHLWALVDPAAPPERRKILIAGTGHERADLANLVHYIGSIQMRGGLLVFHVFESVLEAELASATDLVERVGV